MDLDDIHPIDQAVYSLVHNFVDPTTGKRGAPGIAACTGENASSIQNKANRNDPGRRASCVDAVVWMKAAKDFYLLTAMAAECQHLAIPLPSLGTHTGTETAQLLVNLGKEVGDVFSAATEAAEDNNISMDDADRIGREIQEAIGALVDLDRKMKQQAFRDQDKKHAAAVHNLHSHRHGDQA